MDAATATRSEVTRRFAPVAPDDGLIWLLTLLGASCLLFWSAVIVGIIALL